MKKTIYLIFIAAILVLGSLYLKKQKPKQLDSQLSTHTNAKGNSAINQDNEILDNNDRNLATYTDPAENKDIVLKKLEVNNILKKLFDGRLPDNKSDFDELDDELQENVLRSLVGSDLLEKEAKIAQVYETAKFKEQVVELSKKLGAKIYIEEKIKSYLTDEVLQERYKQFVNEWPDKEEVKAKHILVASEEEAKQVVKDLNSEISFEDEAKSKSTDSSKDKGGDLGYFTKGQMVKEFEDAVLAMNVNEISEPVKTPFGWHVIKLEDKRKIPAPAFNEVKAKLEAELSIKFIKNYNDDLFKKYNVKLFAKNNKNNKNIVEDQNPRAE